MSELITAAVVIFLVVIGPLIVVLHYVTKWRQTREISGDDERMLEELWELSQRLEDRIDTLERILDDEPGRHRREQ